MTLKCNAGFGLAAIAVMTVAAAGPGALSAQEGTYGGTLVAAFSADPGGFDPEQGPSGMSHVVIEQVYGTLLNLDANAVPYAGLAESWTQSDDGLTWTDGLLLDQRESSYPDGAQAPDGGIYIIYDHQRYTLNRSGKEGVGGVMMATFTEADIRAGRPTSDKARLREVISQLR